MKTVEQLKAEQSELLKKKAEYEANENRLNALSKEIAVYELLTKVPTDEEITKAINER